MGEGGRGNEVGEGGGRGMRWGREGGGNEVGEGGRGE